MKLPPVLKVSTQVEICDMIRLFILVWLLVNDHIIVCPKNSTDLSIKHAHPHRGVKCSHSNLTDIKYKLNKKQ
jgi:hypothetical protein